MITFDKLKSLLMAHNFGMMHKMTPMERRIVQALHSHSVEEPNEDVSDNVYWDDDELESIQYNDEYDTDEPEWDRQKAWDSLTDEQREMAIELELTPEDMDERMVDIIKGYFA